MNSFEVVQQWVEDGHFDSELHDVTAVLSERGFTHEEICRCLDGLLPGLTFFAVRTGEEISIASFREKIKSLLHQEAILIDTCQAVLESLDTMQSDEATDLMRQARNWLWQKGESPD